MGLSPKEQMERKNDPHVRFIMENITTYSEGKDYVFISYKSDDWKLVLDSYDRGELYNLKAAPLPVPRNRYHFKRNPYNYHFEDKNK